MVVRKTWNCETPRLAQIAYCLDANSGDIVAFDLTDKDVDDASHVEPLLEQLVEAPRSFMADGAYDRSGVLDAVVARNPSASFIVPPCKGAVPGPTAATSPTHARGVTEVAIAVKSLNRMRDLGQAICVRVA